MRAMALMTTLAMGLVGFSGCTATPALSDDDPFVLAFTMKDDDTNTAKDPQRLADYLSQQTGREVEIYDVTSAGAAVQALRFGHAHAAFLDGGAAWLAWQEYGIEAVAANREADGRTHYVAQAWVRAESDITTLAQLEGRNSCHTGWLKSAGMLMPMGYLIKAGITPVVGDPDDILSLETTIEAFFDEATIPQEGAPYYNYDGAFRCMTEGVGDVAFVKDTSYEDHCQEQDWCLARDAYRPLDPAFGQVPSHPVMVSPSLPEDARAELQAALLTLNDSPEGQSILDDILETPALDAVTTAGHLGDYSENLRHVPGLQNLYESEYGLDDPAQ